MFETKLLPIIDGGATETTKRQLLKDIQPAVLLLFAPRSTDTQFLVNELERVVISAAQDIDNNNRRNIRGRGRHLLDSVQEVITENVLVRIDNINLSVLISLFRLEAEG